MSLPHDPDARLRRNELAMALTECGYPIAASTLSWYACMGGGPPFQKFSRYPIYTWALRWNVHNRVCRAWCAPQVS